MRAWFSRGMKMDNNMSDSIIKTEGKMVVNNGGTSREISWQIMKSETVGNMVSAGRNIVHLHGKWILWIVLLNNLVVGGCKETGSSNLPYYHTPDFTPVWPNETGDDQDTLHRISDFHMLDQSGNPISLEQCKGDILVVNFFFTACPGICPTLTQNIKKVADATVATPGIRFLSFSVTPERDSVPRLAAYAERFSLPGDRWHLLTGDQEQIYTLARRSFFAEEEMGFTKGSQEFLHTEHVLLVDPELHLRGIYKGTLPLEMDQLAEDLSILLTESNSE